MPDVRSSIDCGGGRALLLLLRGLPGFERRTREQQRTDQ